MLLLATKSTEKIRQKRWFHDQIALCFQDYEFSALEILYKWDQCVAKYVSVEVIFLPQKSTGLEAFYCNSLTSWNIALSMSSKKASSRKTFLRYKILSKIFIFWKTLTVREKISFGFTKKSFSKRTKRLYTRCWSFHGDNLASSIYF